MKKLAVIVMAVVVYVVVSVVPVFAFPVVSQSYARPWQGESCFWNVEGSVEFLVVGVNPNLLEGEADLSVSFGDTRYAPVTLGQAGRYVLELPEGVVDPREVCVKVYSDSIWVDRVSLDDGVDVEREGDIALLLSDDVAEEGIGLYAAPGSGPIPPVRIQPPVWLTPIITP